MLRRLSDDILLSHDSPTLLRHRHQGEKPAATTEAGQVVLWRWLSLNRFFPHGLRTYQQTVRPSLKDWDNSSK